MFSGIIENIERSLHTVNDVLKNKLNENFILTGPWSNDDGITNQIEIIKKLAQTLSTSCLKMTLVASKTSSEAALLSILSEVSANVENFSVTFFTLNDLPLGKPLLKAIAVHTRNMLCHIQALIVNLSNQNFAHSNIATGVVMKICEDLQKAPTHNKTAYRRSIMEKIHVINDTVLEFEKSLLENIPAASEETETAHIGKLAAKQDDIDEVTDFFEDETSVYSTDEILIAERCIISMKLTSALLKNCLGMMTDVADKCLQARATQSCSGAGGLSSTTDCETWIAELDVLSEQLEGKITDVGTELYPPIDKVVIESQEIALKQLQLQLLDMLEMRNPSCISLEFSAKNSELRLQLMTIN